MCVETLVKEINAYTKKIIDFVLAGSVPSGVEVIHISETSVECLFSNAFVKAPQHAAKRSVLQECTCRSAGMVVLHTTVPRNGGPRTYNTRNVGPPDHCFSATLVRDGPTKLKMMVMV